MENWMKKHEDKQDEIQETFRKGRENKINADLNSLLDQYENASDISSQYALLLLRSIVLLYETLKKERYIYDEKDYKCKKDELEALEGKVMKEKHDISDDSQSWNDFEEEELMKEEMEDDER